jgi:leucyl aminopeptidase
MTDKFEPLRDPSPVFSDTGSATSSLPIHLLTDQSPVQQQLAGAQTAQTWLEALRFTGTARRQALIPGPGGTLDGAALGLGDGQAGDPSGPSELLVGQLATTLPPATYRLPGDCAAPDLAALAWGLGAYRFRRYKKSDESDDGARLQIPASINKSALLNQVEAVWFGRDLINTPASDMGPDEIEAAARVLAARHGAEITSVVGADLLAQGFPMIHAVGRASPRAPRLIDIRWQKPGGSASAPRVTLIGKGIAFDTGGLDIKPASAMLLMKKDMGGAAAALSLAHMIMGQGLDVRLRVLVAAAENSISGDAFRPGDVLHSRAGTTVEIGNTDAEGRLVLADAISLADDEAPDTMLVFATLTGAARSALGPDLPAMFTDDEAFAAELTSRGQAIGDPVWRLPLWPGYDRHLESNIADVNHIWESPFAGAITAALFLKRFVKQAKRFAHFDLYGWRQTVRALGPKGGEPQTARAVFSVLEREASA